MNRRQARRRMGTRTNRRVNTNGKVIGVTTGSRAVKRKYPRPRSKKNAINVARLMAGKPVLSAAPVVGKRQKA